MKKLIGVAISIILICSCISLVGCENDTPPHTCAYDCQVASDSYIKAPATCTEKAIYYKSCACGKKGEQTFESGEALGHNFENHVCSRCDSVDFSEGLLFALKTDDTYEVSGMGSCTDLDVYIPQQYKGKDVTSIGELAFESEENLTSIIIPDTVVAIKDKAFKSCEGLITVKIGSGLIYIGEDILYDKAGVQKFIVDENNTVFASQDGILYNKAKTEVIIWPNVFGPITLPDTLISVTIPEGCALSSLTIGTGTELIEFESISKSSLLESITVKEGNLFYASQDGILYNKSKTEIIGVPKKISGDIILSNTLLSIGRSSFSGCKSITSMTIPNSVTTIEHWAFSRCDNLTNVNFENPNAQWKVIEAFGANNETISVANSAQNATYFRDTYLEYDWTRL